MAGIWRHNAAATVTMTAMAAFQTGTPFVGSGLARGGADATRGVFRTALRCRAVVAGGVVGRGAGARPRGAPIHTRAMRAVSWAQPRHTLYIVEEVGSPSLR